MKKLKCSGFTALELMIVIAIIAILTALAVPSFRTSLDKQRISRAAEAVLADLRWARAEAIKRNRPVRVTFITGSTWSYTLHADPAGSNTLLKTVSGSEFASTTLTTASFAGDVAYTTFDPTRGIALNDGMVMLSSSDFSAGVIVRPLGRVHVCGSMGGYEACP